MRRIATRSSSGLSKAGSAAVAAVIVVAVVAVVAFTSLGMPQAQQGQASSSSTTSSSTSQQTTSTSLQSSTTSQITTTTTAQYYTTSTTSTAYYTTSTSTTQTTTSGGPISPVEVTIPSGVGTDQSLTFEPSVLTVVIGVNNTIVWTDQDNSAPHTVTALSVPAGAQMFDSGTSSPLNKGSTFTVTLTVPGTYQYHCVFHPAWMKGTIVVKQG